MEESEASRTDLTQRPKPSPPSPPMPPKLLSPLDLSSLSVVPCGSAAYRHFPEGGKRPAGIPPAHPHIPPPSPCAQIPHPLASPGSFVAGHHSRSLSQPPYFSFDALPPLSPSPAPPVDPSPPPPANSDPARSPSLTRTISGRVPAGGLPPRKAHRRSQSDIPFGFAASTSPPCYPPLPQRAAAQQLVKQESVWERESPGIAEATGERKSETDAIDDLVGTYMNLDNIDMLNSSGTEEKREDLDSRASGTRTTGAESSENEAESSANESGFSSQLQTLSFEKKEGSKRTASDDLAAVNPRHCRSLSMDSFMGRLNFGDESPKMPPLSGDQMGQLFRSSSMDGAAPLFNSEVGNAEFTDVELKKIKANDKLVEMALTDPKRVKRILANRQSAARSKERKMRYISQLEHKVQTLQTEATTLSAQLTLLQRDSTGLTSQNNELKIRLQAMEQQAQLRDALNEALTAEVQRLKIAAGEIGEAQQQFNINSQIFQMQQLRIQQQQQQQQKQQQNQSV